MENYSVRIRISIWLLNISLPYLLVNSSTRIYLYSLENFYSVFSLKSEKSYSIEPLFFKISNFHSLEIEENKIENFKEFREYVTIILSYTIFKIH